MSHLSKQSCQVLKQVCRHRIPQDPSSRNCSVNLVLELVAVAPHGLSLTNPSCLRISKRTMLWIMCCQCQRRAHVMRVGYQCSVSRGCASFFHANVTIHDYVILPIYGTLCLVCNIKILVQGCTGQHGSLQKVCLLAACMRNPELGEPPYRSSQDTDTSASIPSKPRTMLMSPVVVALPDWHICPSHGPLALGGLAGFNASTLLVYFLGVVPLWTVLSSLLRNWLRLCISVFLVHSGHQANPSSFHTAWPAKPHSKCSRQKANRKKRVKMRKWQVLDVNGWHHMTKGLRDYQRNFVQGKTRRT